MVIQHLKTKIFLKKNIWIKIQSQALTDHSLSI